ncbi:MAG: hypothetical protein RXO26_05955 [Caldivirga sp.]
MDCILYLEGSVTKVTGRDVGIYVSKDYQAKIRGLQGRRVRVLVIIDECKEGNNH